MPRNPGRRPLRGLAALLLALPAWPAASAQQPAADSAGVHTALRAFYFNLAHRDWEAIAAEVLSAKVVAHRPPPEALVAAAGTARQVAGRACGARGGALVDRAVLLPSGDWIEAFVPRCTAAGPGADEFRLIRFERRWRLVHIRLFDREADLAAGDGSGAPR